MDLDSASACACKMASNSTHAWWGSSRGRFWSCATKSATREGGEEDGWGGSVASCSVVPVGPCFAWFTVTRGEAVAGSRPRRGTGRREALTGERTAPQLDVALGGCCCCGDRGAAADGEDRCLWAACTNRDWNILDAVCGAGPCDRGVEGAGGPADGPEVNDNRAIARGESDRARAAEARNRSCDADPVPVGWSSPCQCLQCRSRPGRS